MPDSLRIHGALTERVGENLSGKGREGNKEGKGSRRASLHHVVTYVRREPGDEMMALRARSAS